MVIAIVTVVNVILWVIMLIRFKAFFSTEKIVNDTRNQVNEILRDLNENANRDIELVHSTLRNLRSMNALAEKNIEALDKKLNFVKQEEVTRQKVDEFSSRIYDYKAPPQNEKADKNRNADGSFVPPGLGSPHAYNAVNPYAAYSVKKPGESGESQDRIKLVDETVITESGASYKTVPVIDGPQITIDPSVRNQKNMDQKSQIKYLYNHGMSVPQIAEELSCSEMEVQFAIDIG